MKFKRNDYFVCLGIPNSNPIGSNSSKDGGFGFVANFIFKASEVNDYNDYQILFKVIGDNGVISNSIRHATALEIEHYEKLKKPFDVTTIIKEKSIPKYITELVIVNNEKECQFICEKDYKDKNWLNYHNTKPKNDVICLCPKNKSWCPLEYWKRRPNTKIYTFEEWCIKHNYNYDFKSIINKIEFQVGKWYKNIGYNKNNYAKLTSKVTDTKFPSTDYINEQKKYFGHGSYFVIEDCKEAIECSLEEIQQYLPDNHLDKIILKTSNTENNNIIRDLITNDIPIQIMSVRNKRPKIFSINN